MPLEGISLHAKECPDVPALVLGNRSLTYRTLDQRTTRLARALQQLGVGAHQPVAAMLPNGFELFEVGLATSKFDATYVPVNWHLQAEEIAWILKDSEAAAIVTHKSLLPQVRPALDSVPDCRLLVVGDKGVNGYEDALAAVDGDADVSMVSAASWSPMFYTSGTTGRPKGVVHGYLDRTKVRMGQEGQRQLWSWSADDVYILSGPAYHAGPGGWAMTALFVGATTVILPAWDARTWLSLVGQHRVTRSFMVPAHFIRLLEIPEQERRRFDLSSLELIVHAAAPCPVEIKRRTIEWLDHVEISELYGASEGGATKITSHEWLARPGSVGTPWPGVEIHILDPAGREQPAGQQGLIFVKPAGGARFEYHDDPDKTAGAWRDQGFTVGDIGYVDDGGYLFITDRATDMIIRGGVNIYPREIEDALYRHPAVVDCAVFGVPDSRSGEAIKAVVETRADVTIEELQSHCRAVLAKYKCPQIVELVGTLPRDPSGKVLKRLLREEHWKDRPTRIG
jgi:long-chain acyl-CoA synthetase